MPAPDAVLELIERFQRNRDQYLNPAYNETQVRREFIDPFFGALGWDIDNRAGYAQQYKDVVHEDAIKVGVDARAPDYSFRVGGVRKFFVEAKKPAVNLKDDPGPAFQLRRYAWSAKLPLSILTDFQELAAYDCRVKPTVSDRPSAARTLYVPVEHYESRWEEIAEVFSKEAILQGSFDRYADSAKAKKGTAEVDKAFLGEIELWRDALARNIALRNPGLSQPELNFAVQVTIDRIIFLRICEDRGIEVYGRLQELAKGSGVYARLKHLFLEADQRYNSGLFHFDSERGRTSYPDHLTPGLAVDDRVLKDILRRLYYPESPYEFSVLPADILGQVYEQFLGKVIRLTAAHRAVVEDKPEVKKAGGVFYTPTYIVDHIVENTVGRLLEEKTPRHASELRILDPACGSGTFLIGAYQHLVDWHRDWYVNDGPEKHRKELHQDSTGQWRLTSPEKKRILLNNIYGVDIDAQAVETTKLSLLLKVLEDETGQSLDAQLSFLRERALPDLSDNIKCGNALIGPEFYRNQQLDWHTEEEERRRINVFDWDSAFPAIVGAVDGLGGFDAVIGNPPYIRINRLVDVLPLETRFIQSAYESAGYGKVDIYVPFIERGLRLLSPSGLMGFIVPNKFLQSDYGVRIRDILARERAVTSIVDFGHAQVFEGSTSYTCLLFLSKAESDSFTAATNDAGMPPRDFLKEACLDPVEQAGLDGSPWSLRGRRQTAVLRQVEERGGPLAELADIAITGVKTGLNGVFAFNVLEERDETVVVRGEGETSDVELERVFLRPYCKAESMKRYALSPRGRVLLYPYRLVGKTTQLVPEEELRDRCPLTWKHLVQNRRILEQRERGKLAGIGWYGLSRHSDIRMFNGPKIASPTLAPMNSFSFDASQSAFPQGAGGGCGLIPKAGVDIDCLLAILNSRVLTYYFQSISSCFQGGWFAYEPRYLHRIPVCLPDGSSDSGREMEAFLVQAARTLTQLTSTLGDARAPAEAEALGRERAQWERRIDQCVFELYGLTADQSRIVEDATRVHMC